MTRDHHAELDNFEGSVILHIKNHTPDHEPILVHDVTEYLTFSHQAVDYAKQVDEISKPLFEKSLVYILDRPKNCKEATLYHVAAGEKTKPDIAAQWTPSTTPNGVQEFSFPASSRDSKHEVSMKRGNAGLARWECFTVDGTGFRWKFDGRFVNNQLTLWKTHKGDEIPVARFRSRLQATNARGGTLEVNEEEADLLVALLTCCAMLRRDQMKR